MKKFPAIIKDGILTMRPAIRNMYIQWQSEQKDDMEVMLTVTRIGKPKTWEQVKTIHGLVIETIWKAFDDRGWDLATIIPDADIPDGYPVSREIIAEILYATCNQVGDEGERKTLSKMNTVEASRFFETCRDYAVIRWSIVIPNPDPDWRNKIGK